MSRIEAVTFSEFYLFEENDHSVGLGFVYPANDPVPLYGMPFQANEHDPAIGVDPAGAYVTGSTGTHLYSDCFAGWGRWDITQVMVTNANPYRVYWCLYKFPPATYKDQTVTTPTPPALPYTPHTFWRYPGTGAGGARQANDQRDIRLYAVLYAQPLDAFTTFTTEPGFRLIVQAGESLWGCVNPGWKFGTPNPRDAGFPASPSVTTTMRVTGDIIV